MWAYGISMEEVMDVLGKQNISAPAGTLYSGRQEYLIRTAGEFEKIEQIGSLPLKREKNGFIRLSDVARVYLGEEEQRSIYHGNGKEAIALNILRPNHGPTVEAIGTLKKFLPQLKSQYPDIQFEITEDQQPIIDINVQGMKSSLIRGRKTHISTTGSLDSIFYRRL